MRGTVAKRIRRAIYGDRATTPALRRLYRLAKRAHGRRGVKR